MNTKNLAAAALILLSNTVTAFAAQAPEAAAGVDKLNLPVLNAPVATSRDAARSEAVELVKNYKTTLAIQLDYYKP